MNVVKCLHDTLGVGKSCEHNHHVKDLMAGPKNIKSPSVPTLRNLTTLASLDFLGECDRGQVTLYAYARAPAVFRTSVKRTHGIPIR